MEIIYFSVEMPNNFLITGSPGSGKTTVIEKMLEELGEHSLSPGGIYCPEIRKDGSRKGFKIIDIGSGKSGILAHVGFRDGPKVGKYRVDTEKVDKICEEAIDRSLEKSDFLVIDEIAPMEVHSEKFRKGVVEGLNSSKPLIAVIHKRSKRGFIGKVKNREDVRKFEVRRNNRNDLPHQLATLVMEVLS